MGKEVVLEILPGIVSVGEVCHAALSVISTACTLGGSREEISARCRFIASTLTWGNTSPTAVSLCGQKAPKRYILAYRVSTGAEGRVPFSAQVWVRLPFCPIRVSS
jgi:hypothetical protein